MDAAPEDRGLPRNDSFSMIRELAMEMQSVGQRQQFYGSPEWCAPPLLSRLACSSTEVGSPTSPGFITSVTHTRLEQRTEGPGEYPAVQPAVLSRRRGSLISAHSTQPVLSYTFSPEMRLRVDRPREPRVSFADTDASKRCPVTKRREVSLSQFPRSFRPLGPTIFRYAEYQPCIHGQPAKKRLTL